MPSPVFRFAPSPNGELHLGHAYSALLNQKFARKTGGRLLLRIEDIDTNRCTPELEAQMLHDLEWLGLEWDGKPRRQSGHFDEYANALETLWQKELVYPATLSRGEIRKQVAGITAQGTVWSCDPDGSPHYPGEERNLPKDAKLATKNSDKDFAIRLDIEKAILHVGKALFWSEKGNGKPDRIKADPAIWGDVILGRKDIPASYHLACVLDDALQGVTHIVRGQDLYHATSIHRLLQELLELPEPGYHHHELVLDTDGNKLSKSNKDVSLRQLREAGSTPADIYRMVFPG